MSDPLLVHESDSWTIAQASSYRLPGYLIVECRHECARMDELDAKARLDLMDCLATAERIVRALSDPERVYTLRFGEMVPRLHFHVIPRTAHVAKHYAAANDDAPPYSGARLVDWLWREHAVLGYTQADLEAFVARARSLAPDSREA